MSASNDWLGAAADMTAALEHWKAMRGKPGEEEAKAAYHEALDHFEEISEQLD